jgi:hypothetical protein
MATWALCGTIDRALNVNLGEDDFHGVWGGPYIGGKEAAVIVNPDQLQSRLELVTLLTAIKARIVERSAPFLSYPAGLAWEGFWTRNLDGLTIGRRMTNERQEVSGCFLFAGDRETDPRTVARSPVVGPCSTACSVIFDVDKLLDRSQMLDGISVVVDGLIDYINEDPEAPLADLFTYH